MTYYIYRNTGYATEWLSGYTDGFKVSSHAEDACEFRDRMMAKIACKCLNAVASAYGKFEVIDAEKIGQGVEMLREELNG